MPSKLDNQQILELYIDKKLSPSKIASMFECAPNTIRYRLKSLGVSLRSIQEACQTDDFKKNSAKNGRMSKGRHQTHQTKVKISKSILKAYEEGRCGYDRTDDVKEKISKSIIDGIKNKRFKPRYNFFPNYNPDSISIIEQKAKELGITDLHHAENGGEYFIKGLGYFVDGYSKEKNIVIEYYENKHLKNVEYDTKRKKEIMNKLNCKFIEIKEWEYAK